MTAIRLKARFFERDTLEVARALLNQELVTRRNGEETRGIIVEVEAYGGTPDPAAHSFRGITKRTEVMFRSGGFVYVYFIYGVHYCMNVVTEDNGVGAAVLIRALHPVDGLEIMKERRRSSHPLSLTNGPGKLCQAMGIDPSFLGEFLPTSPSIWIEKREKLPPSLIGVSHRIGISKAVEYPWRFYVKGDPYVSGRKSMNR